MMSDPRPELEAALRALDRRLGAVSEPAMRREVLLEELEAREPAAAYALLAAVMGRPGAPAPHLHTLHEVTAAVLHEGGARRPLAYDLRAALYMEAARADDPFVMRLLRSGDVAEEMTDPGAALPRAVAELPLGVRRALARGDDLAMLERLLLDADPIVIRHLLHNPRVVESHVLRIAARRPIPASTLREIGRSPRFGGRPRVRTAIARNPYCPTDLAIALLGILPLPQVRDIARDETLHEETRRHARDELVRRKASG
jgi:hypothetical protein